MPRKTIALSEEQQVKLTEILNRRLADAIDLQLQVRQAYWNIKGPNFMILRELFDKIARDVEKDANSIAQRIMQLGGTTEGTAYAVAGRSSLNHYPLATLNGNEHLNALSAALNDFARHARYTREQAIELKDEDTAAIFIEIARGIDKWSWLLESHLE